MSLYKVLLVEDDADNAELVRVILSHRSDLVVLTAATGKAALELAAAEHPDLILQDVHLPDMHGKDILTELRRHPVTAMTPVVVLSGSVDSAELDAVTAAGASGHLMKPYDFRQLLAVIEPFLPAAGPAVPG